jgi:hypothetical protein
MHLLFRFTVSLCVFVGIAFPSVAQGPPAGSAHQHPAAAKATRVLHCLKPETARFFLRTILPELRKLTEPLGIYDHLEKGESVEDVLSFSYELAVISLDRPLGAWNDEIKNRSFLYTYVICPIKSAGSLFSLPEKEESHVKQMSDVRPKLVKGALYRIVITLSIKPSNF